MDTTKPDLSQPELPPPNEKLLRAPTFFEKYGWAKTIIIVAIIVGIVDAGIYFFLRSEKKELALPQETTQVSPTLSSNQIDSWQTYTSQKGLFTFKYPTNYVLKENQSAPQTIQLLSAGLPQNFQLTISYKPVQFNQTLENLIAQNNLCPNISSESATPSLINGEKEAQLYIDASCGTRTKTIVYTINNNMFYMMTIETEGKYEEVKTYTDHILSTFKFLDVTISQRPLPRSSGFQTACPADAKLCPNGSSVGRSGPNCEFAACQKL